MDGYTILIEMHLMVPYNMARFRTLPLFRARQNEISMEGGNLNESPYYACPVELFTKGRTQEGIIILKEL
jgi:hypothetical protein